MAVFENLSLSRLERGGSRPTWICCRSCSLSRLSVGVCFLEDDQDHPERPRDCCRDPREWNFVGYGAEYSPVGICCSAGGVCYTAGIWCTAGVCCCTAGICCGASVFGTAGMHSMVRGGLSPHRRSLLAQNNSRHAGFSPNPAVLVRERSDATIFVGSRVAMTREGLSELALRPLTTAPKVLRSAWKPSRACVPFCSPACSWARSQPPFSNASRTAALAA